MKSGWPNKKLEIGVMRIKSVFGFVYSRKINQQNKSAFFHRTPFHTISVYSIQTIGWN
jgi:hypothetical protein